MREHSITGKVTNQKLPEYVERQLAHALMEFDGHDVLIRISKKRKNRSVEQNNFLHALFTLFAEELNKLGNEFDQAKVKGICKCKFLTVDEVNKETGEVIGQRIKDTSELSTVEMATFIEQIIRWAADMFHIVLPYPNEQLEITT